MNHLALESGPIYSTLGDDPDLGEIVEMFVGEIPERTANLIDCLEGGDWEGLRRAAHQIKGAAGSYGFEPVTPYAARLEVAVRDSKPEEEIREALDTLVAICRKIRIGAP